MDSHGYFYWINLPQEYAPVSGQWRCESGPIKSISGRKAEHAYWSICRSLITAPDTVPYLYDLSILGMEGNLNEVLLTGRRYHYPRKRLRIVLAVTFVAAASLGASKHIPPLLCLDLADILTCVDME